MRDLYEVLEVDRRADPDEIKAAFRRLAARHHPDRNPDDPEAQERFQTINHAYQILSDPLRRKQYDLFGPRAFAPGGFGGQVDFGNIDALFGDLLGALGLKANRRGIETARVTLSFVEAALGCTKEVQYDQVDHCAECHGSGGERGTASKTCGACQGKGKVRYRESILPLATERSCSRCSGRGRIPNEPCRQCRGRGLARARRSLAVQIPAGIVSGGVVSVEGAGSRPRAGEAFAKLEVKCEVVSHELFTRDGDDIRLKVPVSFVQAALGGEVLVPTLEGKVRLRVPPGTQPGTVLRVRGHGVPRRLGPGRGDELVEVVVEVPLELGPRARTLIEELGRELGESVEPQERSFVEKLKNLFE